MFFLAGTSLSAQWISPRTPGIPRTPDGKPDLTAKTPRAADGKPDLSGLWMLRTEAYWDDIGIDLKPAGIPFQPWAAALYKQRLDSEGKDSPIARCTPAGVPTLDTIPTPRRIIQTPGLTAILHEYNIEYRQIFIDGRALPQDPNPNFLGYSVGAWDGDTFVVETIGLKDDAWLDLFGTPATDALHVTERFHRIDFGHLDLDITMTDTKAYSKPWPINLHLNLMPDAEILEYACIENNRGMEHMVGK
ncbi:MAG TPA: hypothetical protein VGN17_21770 [Bryobacteraceae bacterium]